MNANECCEPFIQAVHSKGKDILALAKEISTLRSDLASVKRELAEAREEVKKRETSGWPGCLVMSQDTYNCGIEAAHAAGMAEMREMAVEVAESEPCYPGEPPQLCETIKTVMGYPNPERGVLLLCKMSAKQTVRCISKRINALPTSPV